MKYERAKKLVTNDGRVDSYWVHVFLAFCLNYLIFYFVRFILIGLYDLFGFDPSNIFNIDVILILAFSGIMAHITYQADLAVNGKKNQMILSD